MAALTGRITLILGGIIGALLLGEAVIRVFDLGPQFQLLFQEHFQTSSDPVLGYELRPGALDGKFRISSGGLRDREFPETKPPGVFRIAAIGDSITYGTGAAQPGTWPKRLERLFRLPGTRIEVMNFGVSGYNVDQVAERFRSVALRYQPDLALYSYALNDPQTFSIEASALRSLEENRSKTLGRLGRLLSGSKLFLMTHHMATADSSQEFPEIGDDPAYLAFEDHTAADYFRALHAGIKGRDRIAAGFDALAQTADTARVPVGLLIFPMFESEPGPYPLEQVHAQLAAEGADRGFHVLDLAPTYASPAEPLHRDFLHPNAPGYQLAAETIRDWLCAEALVPGKVCS